METVSVPVSVAILQKEDQTGGSAAQIQESSAPPPPPPTKKKVPPKTRSKFQRTLRRGRQRKLSPQPQPSFTSPNQPVRLTRSTSAARTETDLPTPASASDDFSSPSSGDMSFLRRRVRDLKKANTLLHASLKKLKSQMTDFEAAMSEKDKLIESSRKCHAAEVEELRCGEESRRKAVQELSASALQRKDDEIKRLSDILRSDKKAWHAVSNYLSCCFILFAKFCYPIHYSHSCFS